MIFPVKALNFEPECVGVVSTDVIDLSSGGAASANAGAEKAPNISSANKA